MATEHGAKHGLVHGFVLNGQGGARTVTREQVDGLQLQPQESLWLHWDLGVHDSRHWLRHASGLGEFSCDLLLEVNTRPRLLMLPGEELLLFLRGLNLNPGEDLEDMVSVRVFASAQRLISLRLRSARATEEIIESLEKGVGPKTTSELLLQLSAALSERIEGVVGELSDQVDELEEQLDSDEAAVMDHSQIRLIRRRAAGLRRFLAPQRELFSQLARNRLPWILADEVDYWNELNNRLTRYLEELEMCRERVSLILEAEHRRISERMNRLMYRFGIITCIFLPMSFLTSLLGINTGGIPGADSPWGFLLACLVVGVVGVVQLILFRRLRWM
jgi:zinc transporter